MTIKTICSNILSLGLIATVALSFSVNAGAQSRSIQNYRQAHSNLLANQSNVNKQINVEETSRYARDLYGDVEPEHDIYTEGWESGVVNPYKNSDIPATKVLNVKNAVMPVKWNVVNSHYGYRPRFGRTHKGVDLKANVGDTVYAAYDGKVRLTKFERGGYGFYVIVRHENGLETVYGHLSRFLVKPDQYVKAGTPIALSGNTGRSTGPHLHFETRFMGYAINPEAIFDFEGRHIKADYYTFNKSSYNNDNNRRSSYASSKSSGSRSYGHHYTGKRGKSASVTSKGGKKGNATANAKTRKSSKRRR